jgi:hypothetical protein
MVKFGVFHGPNEDHSAGGSSLKKEQATHRVIKIPLMEFQILHPALASYLAQICLIFAISDRQIPTSMD